MFHEIKASLCRLYREDERPWLVGFSGDRAEQRSAWAEGASALRRRTVHPRRAAQEAHLGPLHGHARGDSRHCRND